MQFATHLELNQRGCFLQRGDIFAPVEENFVVVGGNFHEGLGEDNRMDSSYELDPHC